MDLETLKGIAHLSRLAYKKEQEKEILKSMDEIIDWVSTLEEVNTDGIIPLTHITEEQNVMRKDQAENSLSVSDGLKNAANKTANYFKVPKVL